ncbi:MAG: transglutaminase domain-containing protein, partial [Lachnospiraceae bacterium]|nr:transglutaminase domain-containing protein [Lachnospiraceae bacterium]
MIITPFANIIEEYLKEDTVINYKCESITQLSNQLFQKADNELEYIRMAYEYVRDNISHSADINADLLTCTASEVLEAGHG